MLTVELGRLFVELNVGSAGRRASTISAIARTHSPPLCVE